jgi:hypothetical protein
MAKLSRRTRVFLLAEDVCVMTGPREKDATNRTRQQSHRWLRKKGALRNTIFATVENVEINPATLYILLLTCTKNIS